MKQLYFFIALAYLLVSLTACSQSKSLVKKTDAFFTVRLPGTLPVNEDGQQPAAKPDTTNFIYVEANPKNIAWKEAIIQGKRYSVIAEKLERKETQIGRDKISDEPIRITPGTANDFWRLTFQPKTFQGNVPNKHLILIKAEVDGKEITIPLSSRKEIILPDLNQ